MSLGHSFIHIYAVDIIECLSCHECHWGYRYETLTKTGTMEVMFYRRKTHNEETGK